MRCSSKSLPLAPDPLRPGKTSSVDCFKTLIPASSRAGSGVPSADTTSFHLTSFELQEEPNNLAQDISKTTRVNDERAPKAKTNCYSIQYWYLGNERPFLHHCRTIREEALRRNAFSGGEACNSTRLPDTWAAGCARRTGRSFVREAASFDTLHA